MKTYTPDSPYDGSEEEEENFQLDEAASRFDSKSSQREIVVEGSYTSFMKALALTLINIIMIIIIAVIIYAIRAYFALKEFSRDLHETINQM